MPTSDHTQYNADTAIADVSTGIGDTDDAAVVSGATGSVSAKLRAVSRDIGAVDDAVVAAGDPGTVSAKLRAISRDIGALLAGGITVTAMDLAGIAESTVPPIGTDGLSVDAWMDLYGRLAIGGYDQSRGSSLVHQAAQPLRAASPVITLLDAVSSTQESIQVDLTGYGAVALWIEAAESGGGVNASVQIKRALVAGDSGAEWGSPVALAAAGFSTVDMSEVVPGVISVDLTRTTGTVTVKVLAQV